MSSQIKLSKQPYNNFLKSNTYKNTQMINKFDNSVDWNLGQIKNEDQLITNQLNTKRVKIYKAESYKEIFRREVSVNLIKNCYASIISDKTLNLKSDSLFYLKMNNYLNRNDSLLKSNPNGKFMVCFFCDEYFSLTVFSKSIKENGDSEDIKMYFPCLHCFCNNCGKYYYENKIEEKAFDTFNKCGVYFCNYTIDLDLIIKVISPSHLIALRNDLPENNMSGRNFTFQQPIKSLPGKESTLYIPDKLTISKYSANLFKEDHIILVTHENILNAVNKYKGSYCRKCKLPTLFTKTNKHFSKCLKCFAIYCKYCFKSYYNWHIGDHENNYCKVYSRKKAQNEIKKKKSLASKCCFTLSTFLAKFLLLYLFVLYVVKILALAKYYESCKCIYYPLIALYALLSIVIFIVILPILILLLCIF